MSSSPKLSIIVPIYKVELYLRECVDSILSQTFTDYELILVNDGSPDKCGEICDEYAALFPEKIKVIHKPNGGLSDARNAGLEIARGKYIGFVDSDDAILSQLYERLVSAAENTGAEIVFSRALEWDTSECINKKPFNEGSYSPSYALERIFSWEESVSAWSKLYRREVIGDTKFHLGLTNEDFPFVTEVILKANKVYIIPEGFYRYRVNPQSITRVFRPNYFDIFTNVDFVRTIIPRDGSRLDKAFQSYTLTMHIMSGCKIVKFKANKTYKKWLRKNRRYIMKNLPRFIFDPKLSLRWKLKAGFTFLHLP